MVTSATYSFQELLGWFERDSTSFTVLAAEGAMIDGECLMSASVSCLYFCREGPKQRKKSGKGKEEKEKQKEIKVEVKEESEFREDEEPPRK